MSFRLVADYPDPMPEGIERLTDPYDDETTYPGWRVTAEHPEAVTYFLQILDNAFNYRLQVAYANDWPVPGIYWCFSKREYDIRAVLAEALRFWSDPKGVEPIGWLRSGFGEDRRYTDDTIPELIPVSPPCFVKSSDSPSPQSAAAPRDLETNRA